SLYPPVSEVRHGFPTTLAGDGEAQLDPGGAAPYARRLGRLLHPLRVHAAVLRRARERASGVLSRLCRRAASPVPGVRWALPVGVSRRVRGVRRGGAPERAVRGADQEGREVTGFSLSATPV